MTILTRHMIKIGDTELEVFDDGQSGPIVCSVHTVFGWSDGSTDVAEELGGNCRSVLVNFRGQGGSAACRSNSDFLLASMISDLDEVRRALGIDRWIINCNSLGAMAGMRYAVEHSNAVAGLLIRVSAGVLAEVLADPDSLCSPQFPGWQQQLADLQGRMATIDSGPEWLVTESGLGVCVRNGQPVMTLPFGLPDRLVPMTAEVLQFDCLAELAGLKMPVLIVGGRNDQLTPVQHSIRLREAVPQSDLLILEASGHGVAPADLTIYQQRVQSFLRKAWER